MINNKVQLQIDTSKTESNQKPHIDKNHTEEQNIKKYKDSIHRLLKNETNYQKEIERLQTLIEEQKEEILILQQSLEEKHNITKTSKLNNEKNIIKSLMKETTPNIRRNQHTRILFDLMLFSSFHSESAKEMDKLLDATQFLKKVIDKYSLKSRIPIKKYKHEIDKTITQLESYQATVFDNIFKIKVKKHSTVPSQIYCDALKIDQILLYLLIDLYNFADKRQPVFIDIMYDKKILIFKLKIKTILDQKPENKRLKKRILFRSENSRLSLDFSNKLAKYLNAEIESKTHDQGYTHAFRISASSSIVE